MLAFSIVLLCTVHLCLGFYLARRCLTGVCASATDLIERSRGMADRVQQLDQVDRDAIRAAAKALVAAADVLERQLDTTYLPSRDPKANRIAAPNRGRQREHFANEPALPRETDASVPPKNILQAEIPKSERFQATARPVEAFETAGSSHRTSRPVELYERPEASSSLSAAEMCGLACKTADSQASPDEPATRYPYLCEQLVAPWQLDADFPADGEFSTVYCKDISAGGISFIADEQPDYDTCIISIGDARRPIFMAAEVVHTRSVYMLGRLGYLVGCKFIRRLEHAEVARPLEVCRA